MRIINFTKPAQSGFTLIETILYVAMLTLVMSAMILTSYRLIESSDTTQFRALIHNDAQFTVLKIQNLLNGATSVSTDGSTLTIHYASGPDVLVSKSGNSIQVGAMPLNNSAIAPVSNLTFELDPVSGTRPVQVKASFTVDNPKYYTETFTTSKLLR